MCVHERGGENIFNQLQHININTIMCARFITLFLYTKYPYDNEVLSGSSTYTLHWIEGESCLRFGLGFGLGFCLGLVLALQFLFCPLGLLGDER